MNDPKLRHELKHYINASDYLEISSRLKAVAKRDKNTDAAGKYRIRSLYFDNFDDKALREKINGVNNREKFRIRYYNNDFSFINLERKSKINGLCCKRSVRLTKEQCKQIIGGDIEWMRYSGKALLVELYMKMICQQLRPKTLVDYIREPYVFEPGNVRITIDSEIRTGLNSKDLFNKDIALIKTNSGGLTILEVKYDKFLPNIIRDILQVNSRQSSSFSKYASARIFV